MNLIDMHCDTLWKMLDLDGEGDLMENRCCVSVPRMKKAGVTAQFFACFVHLDEMEGETREQKWESGYRHALWMREILGKQVNRYGADLAFAADQEELENNRRAGKITVVPTIEEGGILNGKIERLEELRRQGFQLITILWNHENCIGHPNSRDAASMGKGLKPFGRAVVERMGELGIITDVSHASDGTFWEVMDVCRGLVAASHSNCRKLCPHPRNLSDEMLRAVADRGGVVGLNFYGPFLGSRRESRIEEMTAHVRHMIRVGGSELPAIGTDFDGFDGMERMEIPEIGQMGRLAHALRRAGLTEGQLEKVWFGNADRLLRESLR